MAREFFKDLPNTTTPLTASRLNGLLNGEEAMGSIVVDDVNCKNLFAGSMYNGIINQSGAYITNNARITNTTSNGFYLPAGTYTLSITDLDACTIVIKNASGTVIQDLADSWKTLPFTFTTTQDGYICFSAKKNNDATLNPSDYTPQLEKGSTATEYTEYKQPVKKTSVGVKEDTTFYANDFKCKNLLGFSNIRNGIYKIGDGTYDGSGTNACCTTNKIEIDNTKNYVLSTANTQTTSYMYVMYYNYSGTYLGYINTTFSTGFIKLNTYSNYSNAKYVNFRFDVPIANLINPQLEVGSQATSYTEYKNFDNTTYVLWTNSNPTSDIANATNFNLSSSNYNYYEIIYNLSTSGTNISITTGKIPKGKGTILSVVTSGATSFSGSQRNITYTNDTTLSSGQPYSFNNTSRTIDASVLIPIIILGYK